MYTIIISPRFILFIVLFFNFMYMNIPGNIRASITKIKGKKIITNIIVKMDNKKAPNL